MIEGFKTKFKWLFSGHYKMERFGVTFGALLMCMVLLLTTILIRKHNLEKENLGNIVKYSSAFASSLSGATGEVVDIFCNDSQTECFILLKYEDMTKVVTDASQYQLFLTGSNLKLNKTQLLSRPSATLYMFGVSGYMGIYLVDTGGFPSQILDLVVRCNKVTGSIEGEIPEYADSSFNDFDQFRIYFNPGASDYTPADFMNMGRMSVYEIYEAMVVKYQEQALRDVLTESISAMETQLSVISEYESRLADAGIIVPPAPMQIRGDRIVTTEDGRKVLSTDYIIPGGYNFDWYYGSVKQGYIKSILATAGESSILSYITKQRALAVADRLSLDTISWTRTDGTEFSLVAETIQSDAVTNIQGNIEALKLAWSTFYEMKKAYQTTQMENLLLLEQNLSDMSVNYTVNANNVITLW